LARKAKALAKKAINAVKKGFGGWFFKKAMKFFLRLVPRKWRSGVKKMLPQIARGHIKSAIRAGRNLITKIILKFLPKNPMLRNAVKMAAPHILNGDPKGAVKKLLIHARSVFIFPIGELGGNPPLFIDCKIKEFAVPLVDMDYQTRPYAMWPEIHGPGCCMDSNTKSNFLDSRKHAGTKGCMRPKPGKSKVEALIKKGKKGGWGGPNSGPFKIKVVRIVRGSQKPVCSFTFTGDSFYCGHRTANCCTGWAYSQPRFTTSDYQPSAQSPGHSCKAWYLGVLALVQGMWTLGTGAQHIQTMLWGKCFTEQCESSNFCSAKSCNQNPKCQWDPSTKRSKTTQNPGWCKPKRVW